MSPCTVRLVFPFLCLVSLAQSQQFNWSATTPPGSPPQGYAHCAALDRGNGQVVLFGGSIGPASSQTWFWNGLTWSQSSSLPNPPARRDACLVYDPIRSNLVLFGGDDGSGNSLGDTWILTGSTWTQQAPPASPSPRAGHAGAWDPASGRVLVFGGQMGPSGPFLGDTWAWDGSTWTAISPVSSPSARASSAVATDTVRNRIVLHGGYNGSADLDDLWEWDGTSWNHVIPSSPASPSGRHSSACAFDSVSGKTILSGGIDASNLGLPDTWSWDGQNWTLEATIVTPPARYGATLVTDTTGRTLVMFGGRPQFPGGALLNDTWILGPAASFSTFGVGCAGPQGTPRLGASPGSLPRLGQSISIELNNLPVTGFFMVAIAVLGTDKTQTGGIPLPLDLTVVGMPGCSQYVDPIHTNFLFTPSGSASWVIGLPSLAALAGVEIHFQALVGDPPANPFGATVTNAGTAELGF